MELQFNKSVIPCLRTVSRELQTQELTQEVRLTDGMPDIGRVLASWGQILIRGKDWRGSGAGVSGGVMVWVLYEPEEEGEPQIVETWLPFQMKWDFPETERDGTIRILPILRGVDARSLSARKLMARAGVGMQGLFMVPSDAELYMPTELPEDVRVLKNAYPVQLPKEAGEKAFNIEETLPLPASVPAVGKLLRYTLRPELMESKVVSDKLVMRGAAVLELLYLGTDGQIHTWEFEIPFSQYTQLDKEYGTDAVAQIDFAVTALELEQAEEENLNLKAGLTGQYVIYERPVIEIIQDAYSPIRTVRPQMLQLQLPAVLDSRTETVHASQGVQSDGIRMADVAFYPEPAQLRREGDQTVAELSGNFQMLYYDDQGQLHGGVARWEDTRDVPADRNTGLELTVQPSGKNQGTMGGGTADLHGDLQLQLQSTGDAGIPMVTGLELSEPIPLDPSRPSLILRRAGGDSLWELAKHTGSTVETIMKANGLQQEPDSDRLLLIPIS